MRTARAPASWSRSRAAGVLAGCGILVVLVGSVAGPAAGATRAAATLGTVVISNIGLGYTVTMQGPLNPAQFAANAPDPGAAKGALSTLAKSISTYERVFQTDGGLNQVQDLMVRFPNTVGSQVFLQEAQHSLESGEIVSSDPLPSIPGARRVTYFAATNRDGVGEAITMRAGVYVDLLSFFSTASGNTQPISPANAETVAQAQYAAMVAAPGGAPTASAASRARKGVSAGTIGLAVLVVAVLALALVTPLVLRRRSARREPVATVPLHADPSDGDAGDDLREGSG